MEVVLPAPEFHFHTAMNTPPPHISAPSSPQNHYFFPKNSPFFESVQQHHHHRHASAPNSPTSAAKIYGRLSSVPFEWEEKPGTPKSPSFDEKDSVFDDFSFSFGFSERHTEKTADELFELGKIRPLKLPPRLMGEQGTTTTKSPRSGGRRGRNRRGKELGDDPFFVAMVEATRSRKESRSLSPFGGRGKGGSFVMSSTSTSTPARAASSSGDQKGKGGGGWKSRFMELIHFRSSSEENGSSECGSLSSSSSSSCSGSSNSSGKGKESSSSSFMSEENNNGLTGMVLMEKKKKMKKMVVPCKQTAFSVRSFAAGKLGASFLSRWA